ncbi:MAG: deoxyhypusine synthase family protein [Candidatus Gastranaerophilales bacterium]|nr:deoxyhypusine synthase family protein [Candidatus Gastranaerophilales bacterium]
MGTITQFLKDNYKHFNSAALIDAAEAYKQHIENGGKMLVTLAGAMSSAELGISLAQMIREDKISAISTTGANLEEDLFNLVANSSYHRVPNYRYLSAQDEENLLSKHLNRVTDTCIPEEEAMRKIEKFIVKQWFNADKKGERYFPHEFIYKVLQDPELAQYYDINPQNSWLLAALEKNLPIFVPGWEDSTLGNFYASYVIKGEIKNVHTVKTGIEYMQSLHDWYLADSKHHSIGFFQIGGGIAGDFPICVVPMLHQDLEKDARLWGYFAQISDSTTSYGSYSGAVPNEKITWGKLAKDTPSFIIESDATIVAPLIFAYVLDK